MEEVKRLRSQESDDWFIPVGLIHNVTGRILAALVLGFQELSQLFRVATRFLLTLFVELLTTIQGEWLTKNPPALVSGYKFSILVLHVWAHPVAVRKRTGIDA